MSKWMIAGLALISIVGCAAPQGEEEETASSVGGWPSRSR